MSGNVLPIPNYFLELNKVDCSDKVEKKNGLSYLSWAYAWGELKKRYPESTYKVYENESGWNYFTDGKTCWVKTGVEVLGIEHIEYLPVMDFRNKSIPLESVTSFDVNKTIQRSLTKAVARHGLGLYIYAGEDLPSDSDGTSEPNKTTTKKATPSAPKKAAPKAEEPTPEVVDYRAKLREFVSAHGIDPNRIVMDCGLKQNSTNEEWHTALLYAETLVGG